MPENYEATIVRPLSAVSSLLRFAEEPQMFAFEFNDGCPIHVSMQPWFYAQCQEHVLSVLCFSLREFGLSSWLMVGYNAGQVVYFNTMCDFNLSDGLIFVCQ